MNTTEVTPTVFPVVSGVFSGAQKAVFVLSSLIFVAIAVVIWKKAKKPLGDTSNYERLKLIYNLMMSCLIGVFVCVVLPHAMLRAELGFNPTAYTVYAVAAFGILLGFGLLYSIHRCARVNHGNVNYTQPPNVTEREEPLLNPDTIEENDHIVIKGADIRSRLFPSYITGMDKANDVTRRKAIGFVLYCVVTYLTIMDGFFVVYWSDKSLDTRTHWVMIVMACVVRVAYSVIVCGVLVHGLFHALNFDRFYKYLISYHALCFLYFLVLVFSSLPLLLDLSVYEVTKTIEQVPFTLFYGICAGVMLWTLTYFVWIQDPEPTRKSTFQYLALFWVTVVILGVTGLFV